MKINIKTILIIFLLFIFISSILLYFVSCDYFSLLTRKEWEEKVNFNPHNVYLYALANDASKAITAYKVNYEDSSLESHDDSPFIINEPVTSLFRFTVDHTNNFMYIRTVSSGYVLGYYIEKYGSLKKMASSPFAIKNSSFNYYALAIDPYLKFIYICSSYINPNMFMTTCTVDKTTGYIKETTESPYSLPFGNACIGTQSLEVDKSGQYLLAHPNTAGGSESRIKSYKINQNNGSLSLVSEDALGFGASFVINLHPNGKYFYFGFDRNTGGAVYGYNLDSGGNISPLPGSPYAPSNADKTVSYTMMHPNGKYIYANVGGASPYFVVTFEIDQSTGTLTEINSINMSATNVNEMAIDPYGRLLFVASGTSDISIFKIKDDGRTLEESNNSPISNGYVINDMKVVAK